MVASNEFKYIFEDDFEVESWTSLHAKTYLESGVFVSVIIAPHDALQDAVLLVFLPGGDLQVAQHQLVLKATFIRHHLSGCGQDTIFLLNDQQTKVKSVFPKLTDCLVNGKKIKSLMTKRILAFNYPSCCAIHSLYRFRQEHIFRCCKEDTACTTDWSLNGERSVNNPIPNNAGNTNICELSTTH